MSPNIYLRISHWGKSTEEGIKLPLHDEILTSGITAGVLQNKLSTKGKAERTISVSRISRHSSRKSQEAS